MRMRGTLAAAIVAAATLLAGVTGVGTAMAAEPADGILLTAAEGTTLENHTFDAYLLGTYSDPTMSADGSTVDNVTVTAADDDVNTWVEEALTANSVDVTAPYDAVGTLARLSTTMDAAKLRAIAKSLAESASKPAPEKSVQGSGESMTLDVADGWYLIVDSNGLPMLTGTKIDGKDLTDQKLGSVMVKSKSIPLTKKVKDENHGEWVDADTTVTGAARRYELTFTMPTAGTASKLTITDVMNGQSWTGADDWQFVPSDIEAVPTATGTGWTVDLSDYLESHAGRQVTINYRATVNADNADNTATLHVEWADGSEPTDVTDKTDLHAYGITLLKTGLDNDDPLEGAGFKIAHNITYALPKSLDSNTNTWLVRDGDHWKTNSDGQLEGVPYGEATELKTDEHGNVTFTGLPEGDYTIKESTVPDGHVAQYAPTFTVHIDADGTVTITGKGVFDKLVSDPAENGVITVRNAENITQLPATGAAGIGVSILLGCILLALAAIPWIRSRMLTCSM